jgi:hypothetical protein
VGRRPFFPNVEQLIQSVVEHTTKQVVAVFTAFAVTVHIREFHENTQGRTLSMRIEFERKGGFTGIPLTASVEVNQLPQAQAEDLHKTIEASGFFSLPSNITTPAPLPDRFRYVVTIQTPQQTHTVTVDETAASPALRLLLEKLSSLARKK